MARLQVDAHFSEPAYPQCRAIQQEVQNSWCMYKDLEIEITRMWQMKAEIIPVVIGALGVIKKGSEKLVREILGNINPKEIQKTILLGAEHILRKVLFIKWQ